MDKLQQIQDDLRTDDIGNDYLLGRQLSHDYNSPQVQGLLRQPTESDDAESTAPGTPEETEKRLGEWRAKQKKLGKNEAEIARMEEGLEEPWIDPTAAFAGGFGGAGVSALNMGLKLIPSFGRAFAAGMIGAVADIPIGAATEKVGQKYPALSMPFNILTGMVSGTLVETTIEKAVIKALTKGGKKPAVKAIKAGIKTVRDNLGTGEIKDELTAGVVKDLNQKADEKIAGNIQEGLGKPLVSTDADKAININLNRINSTDDIKKVIKATSKTFEPEIQEARRGIITNQETEKLADTLGMTPENLLARRKGQAFNAEEALASRNMLVSSATTLLDLAKKVNSIDATDETRYAFRKALNTHNAIQAQVSGMTAEAGRALQSFRILSKESSITTRQIKELLETRVGSASTEDMAAFLSTMDSIEGVTKTVRGMHKAKTWDMFLEAWINGLLSGPATHAVNTLSNSLVAMWQIPERFLAAGVGKLTGSQGVKSGEALAQAFGLVEGFKDGLKAFAKVTRTGLPTDDLAKMEARNFRAITAENVRQLPLIQNLSPDAFREGGVAAQAVDFLGEAVRIPGRMLMAEDEFFKSIGYRMELKARAFRTAMDEGLKGEDAAKRIQQIISDPEVQAPDVHLAAVNAARYQTFTKELGGFGKGLQSMATLSPVLRLIVPFIRTPANIIKFAGERTPLAGLSKNVRADIAAGGARRDLAIARMSMGSMVMTTAVGMTTAGYITGGGPSDPKMQSIKRNTGWQPYSILVGDKYYSYNRLEPVGMLLGLAADTVEIMGQMEDEDERDHLATQIVSAIAKNVTSKTWLRGVSEAVQAIEDPDRYGNRYIQNFIKSMVPTGVAQIERAMDPELEAVYNTIDAIKSRIPGLSNDLPPRRNIWGKPIVLGGGLGPDIMSPIYTSEKIDSPVDEELLRLNMPVTMPRRVQALQGVAIELTPKEFDRFMVLMNDIPLQSTNSKLKPSLDHMVKKDLNYKRANNDRKEIMVKQKLAEAKALAREKLLEEYPVLQEVIRQWRLKASD